MDRCSEGPRALPATRASDLTYVEVGHIALPPGDRSGWERNTLRDDWLKLRESWSTGGEAGPEEDWGR